MKYCNRCIITLSYCTAAIISANVLSISTVFAGTYALDGGLQWVETPQMRSATYQLAVSQEPLAGIAASSSSSSAATSVAASSQGRSSVPRQSTGTRVNKNVPKALSLPATQAPSVPARPSPPPSPITVQPQWTSTQRQAIGEPLPPLADLLSLPELYASSGTGIIFTASNRDAVAPGNGLNASLPLNAQVAGLLDKLNGRQNMLVTLNLVVVLLFLIAFIMLRRNSVVIGYVLRERQLEAERRKKSESTRHRRRKKGNYPPTRDAH